MKLLNSLSTRASAVAIVSVGAATSQACSVCIAHAIGAGLQAIGSQTLAKGKTIMGFSYRRFSKSNSGEMPGTIESHSQSELSLDVLHGLTNQWMLRASVPQVGKQLAMTGAPNTQTSGLGDISLGASYQIPTGLKDKVLFATSFDVKLPTGANNLKDMLGARLDEHNQVGTGSTDFTLGIVATIADHDDNLWFAGLRNRWNGANKTGYRYGEAFFYNVGVAHTLNSRSSVVLEFNGRKARADRTDLGTFDENSGGQLTYLSLSFRHSLGQNTGVVASYQMPIIKRLNGAQSENGVFLIGIFRQF